jgi:hypothetical protein
MSHSSAAAATLHLNMDALSAPLSISAAALAGEAPLMHTSVQPAVQQSSLPLAASQSHAKSLDFDAALGKLAEAATGIPFDIVYKVYVRRGHDVEAANHVLVQIKELHDALFQKCSFSQIESAMVKCSDSCDAALALLEELLPAVPEAEAADEPVADAAPVRETAPPIVQEEDVSCVICYENPRSHAFIPCGHLSICGVCKKNADGLHGKCPICNGQFTNIVHIFPS